MALLTRFGSTAAGLTYLLSAVGLEVHQQRPIVGLDGNADAAVVRAVAPEQVECSQRYRRKRLTGDRRFCVRAPVTLEVIELLPGVQGETPGRDCLQKRRLACVIGASDDEVPWKHELRAFEALEPFNEDTSDHQIVLTWSVPVERRVTHCLGRR